MRERIKTPVWPVDDDEGCTYVCTMWAPHLADAYDWAMPSLPVNAGWVDIYYYVRSSPGRLSRDLTAITRFGEDGDYSTTLCRAGMHTTRLMQEDGVYSHDPNPARLQRAAFDDYVMGLCLQHYAEVEV